MIHGDAAGGLQNGHAVRCQVQLDPAAIRSARSSFDQTGQFHLVQDQDQTTRKHPQALRQGLLAQAMFAGDDAENAGVRGHQPQRFKALGKLLGGVRPDLGQQKGDSVRLRNRRGARGRWNIVIQINNYLD